MWSVEAVLRQIREAGTSWRAELLRPVADLRFTYEQEPSPEDFFTPYIWSVVYQRGGLGWDPSRISLFQATALEGGGGGADEVTGVGLSSIDVDNGATGGGD